MKPAIGIGRIGLLIDTTTYGFGITYDHIMEATFGMHRVSLVTINLLCLHIMIVISKEPMY